MKKKLVVLTGAGMSAESGISTFRDSDGLWEKYRVEDVATPKGFAADPELVLNFYNQRRRELRLPSATETTSPAFTRMEGMLAFLPFRV